MKFCHAQMLPCSRINFPDFRQVRESHLCQVKIRYKSFKLATDFEKCEWMRGCQNVAFLVYFLALFRSKKVLEHQSRSRRR